MATDDVLVINAQASRLVVRQRTSKSGRTSTSSFAVTTNVTSEPTTYMLDERLVAQAAARAIAEQARIQTSTVPRLAKDSTIKARETAYRAIIRGERWAMQRYAGGRTGLTPPQPGNRNLYYASGRLANGIVATYRKDQKDFAINYPANRWNPKFWRSRNELEVAFQRWIDHVPVLKEPRNDLVVQKALRETHAQVAQKHRMGASSEEAVRAATVDKMAKEKLLLELIKAAEQIFGGG